MSDNKSLKPVLVVGIGASAGGLESFKAFLSTLPEDTGMAFVLLPHLNPDFKSLMPELLESQVNIPVIEAKENEKVKPDHVYISPAGNQLTLTEGYLHLQPVDSGRWTSIETFLISLAVEQKQRAVAIIMSGTGNHGIAGIREIKHHGGMIFAQSPSTCRFEQMPIGAIESGLVDLIMAPEEMPQALIEYSKHPYLDSLDNPVSESAIEQMLKILALVRKDIKHDFSCYRKNMLLRRIQRRMSVCHCNTLPEYYDYLQENSDEILALCKDLLIGVTAFFRDPEAFHVIEQRIIPELIEACSAENPIRVWVPACATGEEAYSLAILFLEGFAKSKKQPALQIFASDIDEDSLKTARQGVYPEALIADIPPERSKHFFTGLVLIKFA